jgi:hypothetical protein
MIPRVCSPKKFNARSQKVVKEATPPLPAVEETETIQSVQAELSAAYGGAFKVRPSVVTSNWEGHIPNRGGKLLYAAETFAYRPEQAFSSTMTGKEHSSFPPTLRYSGKRVRDLGSVEVNRNRLY